MNGIQLGTTSIAFNLFHTGTTVNVGEINDEKLLLAIGVGSPTIVQLDGESFDATRRWAVCSATRKLVIDRPANSGVLFLAARRDAIERRILDVLDQSPTQPIVFDRSVSGASGVGAQVRRILDFVIQECSADDSIVGNQRLRSHLGRFAAGCAFDVAPTITAAKCCPLGKKCPHRPSFDAQKNFLRRGWAIWFPFPMSSMNLVAAEERCSMPLGSTAGIRRSNSLPN